MQHLVFGPMGYSLAQWVILSGYSQNIGLYKNKPSAQAAGADPSQCTSTNKQNPPFS